MVSKRDVLDVAGRAGLGRSVLDLYDRLGGSVVPSLTIEREVLDRSPETWHGTVVLPVIGGDAGFSVFRYCVLAHAYRQRGYEPVIPLCNADLNLCHQKTPDDRAQYLCDRCHYKGMDYISQFGLEEYVAPLALDPPTPDLSDDTRCGVDIAKFALASTKCLLKKYTIEFDSEPDRTTYLDLLSSAAALADFFTRLLEERDVDLMLAHDPVYIYGGVPLAVAYEHGVPAYAHSTGYRDGMLLVSRVTERSILPQFSHRPSVREFLSTKLDADQRGEIDRIMEGRATGETTGYHYSSRSDRSVEQSVGKTTVGMFTNLIWDGSLNVDRGPFSDVFDWIFGTIDALSGADDVELIVKPHPAEAKRGTNEAVHERIRSRYGSLPPNVVLLEPDTEVNTYELINDLDAGIVFNSTVGLEMAYRGVPVVTGGETHYRNHDVTYDPETSAAYFDHLSRIGSLEMSPNRTARAQRYAYYFLVKKHFPFPFFELRENVGDGEYLPVTQEKIGSDNEFLELLIDQTTSGAPEIVR